MKVVYEIDPHNRLVIKGAGKNSRIPRFRTCLEGTFKTGQNNSLFFYSRLTDEKGLQQIKFQGKWSMDKGHNLVFTLNKWQDQIAGNKLIFQGEISNLNASELAFSLASKQGKSDYSIYLMKLSGALTLDNQNRLGFEVERDKEKDALKFSGSWQVENNSLVYSYEKSLSSRVKRTAQKVSISGHWDIKEKYRLSYRLERDTRLEFKTSVGELINKAGRSGLKYEVGVGLAKNRKRNAVMIFGRWLVKNGVGIVFEVEYEDGSKYPITFSGKVKLSGDYTFEIALKNTDNENLGVTLQLSRKILNAGEGFIRLLAGRNEKAIEIGAGFRW